MERAGFILHSYQACCAGALGETLTFSLFFGLTGRGQSDASETAAARRQLTPMPKRAHVSLRGAFLG